MNGFDIAFAVLGWAGCGLAVVAEVRRREAKSYVNKLYAAGRDVLAINKRLEARAKAAEASVMSIRHQRSETTRKGNATRRARKLQEQAQTTARLKAGL